MLRQALEGRHETDAGRIQRARLGARRRLLASSALTIFPALYLLWASFRRFNLMMPDNAAFIGLENYRNIVTNADIRHSMLVTILFVVAAVGIELVLGSVAGPYARAEKPLERRRRNAPDPADGRDAGGFGARLARAVQPQLRLGQLLPAQDRHHAASRSPG